MGRRPGGKNRLTVSMNNPDNQGRTIQDAAFPSIETLIDAPPKAREYVKDGEEKRAVAESVKSIPEIFTPEHVEWVFDAYVALLCFVYSITLKTDFKELQSELEFDAEQKKNLSKPLARILSKYAPSEWAGMSAEIELITMMGIWSVSSFGRAKIVAVKVEEDRKKSARTAPVAPMRPREQNVPA